MKFGIFYEHQIGRPWEDDTDVRLIHDALEQIELADRLGIQYVWEVEHHFLEEYSHSSAPEVFLAAASQRTSASGSGTASCSPRRSSTIRRASPSGSRCSTSSPTGASSSAAASPAARPSSAGSACPRCASATRGSKGLETAIRCMVETPFTGVDGEFVSMPPRNVVPKPVQKPHPPLWVACSRRETILLAARKGMGALTFAFIDPEEARHWVTDYERTLIEECVPVGFDVNPQVACVTPMMLHHDEGEAIRRGAEGANFFGYSLGHYYVFGTHRPGVTNVWQEYEERRGAQGYDPEAVARAIEEERLGAKVAAGDTTGLRGCTGTPEQAREYLRRYEEAGVDQVIFVLQAGRNRHEHIMESIELFGREVLPEFVERDAAAAEAQAATARAARRGGARPQADDHASTSATTRSTRCPSSGPTPPTTRPSTASSPSSPTTAPPAAAIRHWGSSDDPSEHAERLWDPADPAFRADPYPFYDRLRTEAPVYRAPGGPLVVSRYDDVVRVLRSNDFSRDVEANATHRRERPRSRSGAAIAAAGRRRSSTSTRPTTHGCAGSCRRRSRRAPSTACGRGSRRWSTTCSTAPPNGARSSSSTSSPSRCRSR